MSRKATDLYVVLYAADEAVETVGGGLAWHRLLLPLTLFLLTVVDNKASHRTPSCIHDAPLQVYPGRAGARHPDRWC